MLFKHEDQWDHGLKRSICGANWTWEKCPPSAGFLQHRFKPLVYALSIDDAGKSGRAFWHGRRLQIEGLRGFDH